MALFLHKVHPIFFNSITKPKFHRFLQIVSDDPQNRDNIVTSICNSFGKDSRWETLTEKFSSIPLNSTLVQEVLIQLKDPENAKNALAFFHWSTKHMNFNHGVLSYCLTIHILAKAKLVRDAKALLESILKSPYTDEGVNSLQEGSVSENLSAKDGSQLLCVLESLIASYEIVDSLPLVYDLFVQTCAKLRMIDEILDACEILAGNGFGLSIVSYNTLLHVIQRSEKCHLVWNVYEQMLGNRVNPSEVTFRIMVSAMGKEGKLGRFLDVVERMNGKRCTSPGLLVNTCLVFGIIEEGRIEEGLILLKRLSQKNMILDTIAFSLVVFAKVKMGDLHAAREVYDEMLKRGFEGNPVVTTCFIVAYCEAGWTKEALALIQEMESLDIKPYYEMFNHLIDGCSKIGYLDGNLKFCERMVKMEFLPDKSTFEKMLEMLIANGEVKTADDILTSLIDKGFVPDETTYSLLVTGYAKISDAEGVLKRYHEMEYRSISPSSSTFCAIVACLHQTGRAKEAWENYANPRVCLFHVLFKGGALAFYILSTLFFNSFVIIFVVTVLLAALDFWVVKNVSGRILVGLRWWNEINDEGESVWRYESLDQESLARINKKDSWLFWWTLYLSAAAWFVLGIFSLIKFQADYLLVVGVCFTLSFANIVGFTRCQKDAKKQLQAFATQTITSRMTSTIQSAFSVV